MEEFCGIKIPLHDPCSISLSATPCVSHDPRNPQLANLKEKLRIANAWICTDATGRVKGQMMA
jgi:hypothetical protein